MALLTNILRAFEFNEGSGTTATDETGTTNGVISGATYDATNKKLGSHSLSFVDGTNDEVDLGSSLYNGLSAWTFSAWVRTNDANSGDYIFAEGSIPDGIILYSSGGGTGGTRAALSLYINGTNNIIDADFFAAGQNLGDWVMLTLTYDGTSYKVYSNTSLIGTVTAGAHTGGGGNTIIGNRATGARSWKGQIDSVYMSSDEITTTDMATLYNSGAGIEYNYSASASSPTVTTQAVSSIAATTATGNGNVTADGGATITERGVCWNTSTAPTTANSTATSAGTTGAFTASMTGLTAGTLYYVRAYAINSEGTSYGAEVTFTTDDVPDAFVIGDWTLTDLASSGDARIAISTLPADNGAAITDLEYKKDAGSWTSLGGTATGNYDLSIFTDGVSANIQIRAVNAVGNGADSDTKSVTTTAAATAPAQFATDGWSVADRATDGAIRITITTLPDDGGSAITDLEYQLDAGSWVSMSTTTTGTFDVTGLTNDQEYDVAVRAVNSVGNGTASATKAVTPTVAPAFTAAATDVIYVLDVSDTTNSTEGELKPVSLADLKTYFTA